MAFDPVKLMDFGGLGVAVVIALVLGGIILELVKAKFPSGKNASEAYSGLSSVLLTLKELITEWRAERIEDQQRSKAVQDDVGTIKRWLGPNESGVQEWKAPHAQQVCAEIKRLESDLAECRRRCRCRAQPADISSAR